MMLPVVFINSRSVPYVDMIMDRQKPMETRSRDMLRFLAESGTPFLIAETGKGDSLVRCSARIRSVLTVYTADEWNRLRSAHRVPAGSQYDWKDGTKKKVLYELCDILPVPVPFHPSDGIRHGRVWMESDVPPEFLPEKLSQNALQITRFVIL